MSNPRPLIPFTLTIIIRLSHIDTHGRYDNVSEPLTSLNRPMPPPEADPTIRTMVRIRSSTDPIRAHLQLYYIVPVRIRTRTAVRPYPAGHIVHSDARLMVVGYCPERARENRALPLIVKLTYNATKAAISVELEIIAGQVYSLYPGFLIRSRVPLITARSPEVPIF